MIWCFLSSVLFDCYDELAYSATYCNLDRSHRMKLGMVDFVDDDSNGQTNDFMHTESDGSLPITTQKLRHNAQACSDLLGASGGTLELSKCLCHLLHWKFGVHGDPVLVSTRPSLNYPVIVTDPLTHAEHGLTFLSPYTAHKTLGNKEPAGSQREQYRVIWQKSNKKTEFI